MEFAIIVALCILFASQGAVICKFHGHCWMSDSWKYIKDKTIFNLAIPGTHHSAFISAKGNMSSLFSSSAQCQERSVTEQLCAGIRFLDIRLSYNKQTKQIVISHYFSSTIKFTDILDEIDQFVRQNSREIVILLVREDWDAPLGTAKRNEAHAILLEKLGRQIIRTRYSIMSFELMLLKGRVIVAGFNDIDASMYVPYQLSWAETKDENGEAMLKKTATFLQRTRSNKSALIILDLIVTIGATNFYRAIKSLARPLNEKILEILTAEPGEEQFKNIREIGTIFMLDYYNDALVKCIANLNKRR